MTTKPALQLALKQGLTKCPPPPRHLRPATRRWWRAIVSTYELEEHHLRVLEAACSSWDRAEQAREAVDATGVIIEDRWGQLKANPATVVERDQRALFGRLLAQLGLDVPEPKSRR
ncbi:MAG TPA: P27 family phage terminase small subunit [Thermoanaerobaculaceae bacterium]|nr:P27 family phage terminase small subunit [Thermoanaerobaculaceae bacterium]HRS16580.1 P27 family phage terminase small subunit [Thermoanaerobaculaceae bacterium]